MRHYITKRMIAADVFVVLVLVLAIAVGDDAV